MNLEREDEDNYYMLHILHFTYLHILTRIPNNYRRREGRDFIGSEHLYTWHHVFDSHSVAPSV